jgi:Zn-finger nucleic acid-binding protein
MRAVFRTLTRCLVCGSCEVRTDEVIDRGLVFLAECPRCEHRWTSRAPLAPLAPAHRAGAAGRVQESATAA